MNFFVFTTGCYSDYSIREIYQREQPLAEGEMLEMIRAVAARVQAYKAEHDREWTSFHMARGLPTHYNTRDAAVWKLYAAISHEFSETGWGATHPERDELAEELARLGFLVVPFNEVHLYDYGWEYADAEAKVWSS